MSGFTGGWMRLHLLVGLALVLSACGGKKDKDPEPAGDDGSDGAPVFVPIEIEEDDPEIMELMTYTAECGDIKKLEPSAMMGRLADGEIRCLDKMLREAEKQTFKDRLSRVLMADAWSKGNLDRWETIVRRHLNEIDRSDPDLCYKFALHMFKRGPQFADETIKWADTALERRTAWKGDTHVSRVYNLYRLKAQSALRKWDSLEAAYLKDPNEELQKEKTATRNIAKTLAREWLEYAREAGKDDTIAMQMCVSAAGTAEFCENVGK